VVERGLRERLLDHPVVETAIAVNDRYTEDLGNHLSASIAFFGFLSLFPIALLALSVAGFVFAGDPAAADRVVDSVAEAVPGLEAALGGALETAVRTRGVTGLVGLVGVLFAGLRVIDAAALAVSRVFRVEDSSGALARKLRALRNLVILGALTLLATSAGALAGVVGAAAEGLGIPAGVVQLRGVLAFALSFGLDVLLFLVAFRVLASVPGPPWSDLVPGALLAAAGWTALKVFGAAYVGNTAAQWDAIYGALGVVIGAMLLLLLAGRIFLYGAELNALLAQRRREAATGYVVEPTAWTAAGTAGGSTQAPAATRDRRRDLRLLAIGAAIAAVIIKLVAPREDRLL
jgi:membrane protein